MFRKVLGEELKEERNPALIRMEKFAPLEDFYLWIYTHFGLRETESPSLKEIFATLAWCHAVNCAPEMEAILPRQETRLPNTCYVFLEDWLQEERGRKVLKPLVQQLESDWGLYGKLQELPLDSLVDCLTFPLVDEVLLENLQDLLLNHPVTGLALEQRIDQRLSGYWAEEKRIRRAYDFFAAALALTLCKEESSKVHYRLQGRDWIRSYTEHDYPIDQTYRKLMWIYNQAGMPDELTSLRDHLTQWMEEEFLPGLADYTDRLLSQELAAHWPIHGVL